MNFALSTVQIYRYREISTDMSQQQEKRDVIITMQSGKALSSIREMQGEMRKLRKEFQMTSSDDSRKKIAAEMKALNEAMGKQNAMTRALSTTHQAEGKKVASTWEKVGKVMTALSASMIAMAGFQWLTQQFRNVIQRSAELSDSLADVRKTTGLTDAQVQQLNKSLSAIDTRSSRKELLGLAYEAGKLGISGVKDVQKFVEQADKIKVALGEDLGEGAVLQIGKMAAAFKTEMVNIGSAVNELGANSKAQEQYIVDFTARMQGTAVTAKIAAADIMGYAAVLDSLGIQAEMSATALNTFFIDFIKNTEEMGKVAGFAKGELTKLVGEEGTNAGFVAFLTKLKEANPEAADFARKLEQLGVDGARGSQVFLALSNNLDMVGEMQGIANKSFKEGTSILDEFNVKNNNLAANLDIITKKLGSMVVSSGFTQWLTGLTKSMRDYLTIPLSDKLKDEHTEMNLLVSAISNTSASQRTRLELIDELMQKYPQYFGRLDKEKTTNEDLRDILKEVNAEYRERIKLAVMQEELQEIEGRILEQMRKQRETQTDSGFNKAVENIRRGYQIEATELADVVAEMQRKVQAGFKAVGSDRYNYQQDIIKTSEFLRVQRLQEEALQQVMQERANLMGEIGEQALKADSASVKDPLAEVDALHARFLAAMETAGQTKKTLTEEEKKRMQEMIDNTKRLQEQLQKVRIDAIENVEKREIAAVQDAYVRRAQEIEATEANEQVKADLIAALAEQTQRKVAEIEREAAEERVKAFQEQVRLETQRANDSNLLTLELQLALTEEGSVEEVIASIELLTERVRQELQQRLADDALTAEQRLMIEQDLANQIQAMWDAYYQWQDDQTQDNLDKLRTETTEVVNVMSDIFGQLFAIMAQGYENQLAAAKIAHDEELASLQRMYDEGIISKEEYERRKHSVDTEAAQRERQIKRDQFEADQNARVIQSIMDTLGAVVEAAPNYVLMAAMGVLGAGMTAAIAAEPNPYYKGGRTRVTDSEGYTHNAQQVGSFAGGGYYSTPSLGIVGERGEELVVPNWVLNSPDYADSIAHIEHAIVRGYAKGGRTVTSTGTSGGSPSTSSSSAPLGIDINVMADAINRNTAVLEMLLSGGITAKAMFPWQDFVSGVYDMEEIENARYFRGSDNRRPGQRI